MDVDGQLNNQLKEINTEINETIKKYRLCDICKKIFYRDGEKICYVCRSPAPNSDFEMKNKKRNGSLYIKAYPGVTND